jgi:hypothetical protein
MSQKKVPITRLAKFFGQEDFALDISMGEEWLHGDMNFTLVLYRVDAQNTKTDDVYGEVVSDGIKFFPPVEFKGYVKIEAPTNDKISNSGIDITYGDYIGYYESESRVRYYMVVDDGRVTSDNKHTYGGYKPFYRTILATYVPESEFRAL